MLSKNKIKYFKTLQQKKHRDNAQVFIIEGHKMLQEAIRSDCEIICIVATEEFIQSNSLPQNIELIPAFKDDIAKISCLKSAPDVWAIVSRKIAVTNSTSFPTKLALDSIQDPGNMGTILRVADWFSIKNIICSYDCVDVYNPKVVQASMGAIFRMNIVYTDLPKYLENEDCNIYGTFLEGENIYTSSLEKNSIIVMGNEGNGISKEVEKLVSKKIHIPSGPESQAESLNVAVATSIICSEFFRR